MSTWWTLVRLSQSQFETNSKFIGFISHLQIPSLLTIPSQMTSVCRNRSFVIERWRESASVRHMHENGETTETTGLRLLSLRFSDSLPPMKHVEHIATKNIAKYSLLYFISFFLPLSVQGVSKALAAAGAVPRPPPGPAPPSSG